MQKKPLISRNSERNFLEFRSIKTSVYEKPKEQDRIIKSSNSSFNFSEDH